MRINAGELMSTLELDLYSQSWDGSVEPYPGIGLKQFAMQHLHRSFTKKYLPGTTPKTSKEADAKALSLFMEINERCRTWSLDSNLHTWEEQAVNEVKSLIDDMCFRNVTDSILGLGEIYSNLGLGPGSNIGALEGDLYSKLSLSKLTFTDPSLLLLYQDAIRNSPTWCGMEQLRAEKMGYQIVKGSRLSFVPKTTEISRTICTEPILNMMFQKGIGSALEKRLQETMNIYLSNQPDRNAELARIGSRTGKYATIDLSSASDSISTNLVKTLFPSSVVSWLMRARSPTTRIPTGEIVELHMISSMGNAFTFPLQTMIFAAVVAAAYKTLGITLKRSSRQTVGNFAVFGDDIIVDTRAYALVTRILSLFGFSVNSDKSFFEGPFRESCGHDYFHGHNVRGVYVKSLRDVNDCYSAINRLVRWCARHDLHLFRIIDLLLGRVKFLPVPRDESDDAGIKVPQVMLNRRILHPKTRAVMYRYSKLKDRRVCMLPKKRAPNLPNWFENPDGLLVALLAGSIRFGFITLRQSERKAVFRTRYSSRWDYDPSGQVERPDFAESWKSSAVILLSKEFTSSKEA